MYLAREDLQPVRNELIQRGNSQAGKHGAGFGAAFFTGKQYFGAGGSFRIGKHAVLLYNQRRTQRHHKQNAEDAAAKSDQSDLNEGGRALSPFLHPHEHGGQCKNRARRDRFTGGTDRLNHIIFQNRFAVQNDADNSH